MHKMTKYRILSLLIALTCLLPCELQADGLPSESQVIEICENMNDWFMQQWPNPGVDVITKGRRRESSLWTRAVYYEGLMALHSVHPKQAYYDYTLSWAQAHRWTPRHGTMTRNADDYCCAQTYIDMYRLKCPEAQLDSVKACLENILKANEESNADWTWIDAIQMGMPVLMKMSRLTGDKRYAQKAWQMYHYTRDILDHGLLDRQNGLWWRDADFNPPYQTPQGQPCYWSRGDGWVVAALVRVLNEMEPGDNHYTDYQNDLSRMLRTLALFQRPDGFWNCSLADEQDFGGPEVTGTSLFAYGYAWAIRKGILSANEFLPTLTRAWQAMARSVHADGQLGYQQGTGKQPSDSQPVGYDLYPDFNDFGIGCFLLGATEIVRLTQELQKPIVGWPVVQPEAKPGTRWWWMGSAVDEKGLTSQMEQLSQAGIGAVEITPIYGVQDNETREISFLSTRWMEMLRHTQQEGKRLGIQVDMNTGTGWPFGGPNISSSQAAQRLVPQQDSIVYKQTGQKVKRAAPGGEGWVMDHLDKEVVQHYLSRFTEAFDQTHTAYPSTFFNDSYEVYGADWSPTLPLEFEKRRGYRIQDRWADFLTEDMGNPRHCEVLRDYRETMSDMLLENFTHTWNQWAHLHGAKTRNQAHGSPANLLDCYGAVDIPETEGYGLSDFGISGLRTDSLWKRNDSNFSMMKYASSAAHVTGKPFTSSETFTWLGDHFRTSLSQCKPDLDLLFTSGINRCFFHGTTYSPQDAAWPGWLFYASMQMSPINTIWADAPAFFQYITRCQSFLQWGTPANDLLIYFPVHDIWYQNGGRMLPFEIGRMGQQAPQFVQAVMDLSAKGYDVDYISDRQLSLCSVRDGRIVTQGGTSYSAIVVVDSPQDAQSQMPEATHKMLQTLQAQGARILSDRQALHSSNPIALREELRAKHGLSFIRRSNPTGYHYFISSLQPCGVDTLVALGTPFQAVVILDPLTGQLGRAETHGNALRLQLASGQSCLLQTYTQVTDSLKQFLSTLPQWNYLGTETERISLGKQHSWTLDADSLFTGTKSISLKVKLTRQQLQNSGQWVLDLGDVRESAHVYVNGHDAGVSFCVPYRLSIPTKWLHRGSNRIRVVVTSLAANRISRMDRRGERWRIFKDANIAPLPGYGKVSDFSKWELLPAGLCSEVFLIKQ